MHFGESHKYTIQVRYQLLSIPITLEGQPSIHKVHKIQRTTALYVAKSICD